ncbi:hypothetical protein [uncultured Tenacibaculum sp.]|uniref:hypothetical protein n=1 Tax=uncultured Tenacibaculum sp. TaxID=174713 RepID=UPI00263983F9|nr:hypothetical protein [uncultured Tenacibaculum sp.]
MNSTFLSETYKKDFTIDIQKLNECKGIYKLEIFVPRESTPLLIDDGSEQYIREDLSEFKIESPVPLKYGFFKFKFQEKTNLSNKTSKKIATVRYLYCNE